MAVGGGLERATRIEAMLEFVGDVAGKRVIDIGCGEGQVAQALAERGAHVLGFDPFIPGTDEVALGSGTYRLQVGSADSLPLADGIADVVLFMFSLHHVPGAMMPGALAEARRVLKPGGQLCVVEPIADGPAQYVMAPYHDETAVRADALAALADHATPAFASERVRVFAEPRAFAGFDDYAGQAIANMRYTDYSEAAVLDGEVRRRFEEMATLYGGRLDQPVRINLYR